MQIGPPTLFVIIWSSTESFVYETLYGGAERSAAGRRALRLNTKAQALALGRQLAKASPSVKYSVYKMGEEGMVLLGSYPKRVNAEGARIRFRR